MGRIARIDAGYERSGQRREHRLLGRMAKLDAGDAVILVHLADLTRYGCRLEGADLPDGGTIVTIGIGGIGRIEADVVWRSEDAIGCVFPAPCQRVA